MIGRKKETHQFSIEASFSTKFVIKNKEELSQEHIDNACDIIVSRGHDAAIQIMQTILSLAGISKLHQISAENNYTSSAQLFEVGCP